MRCLSLWNPWATLIAIGAKKFETRGWAPDKSVRGLLAIHAAKKRTGELIELCQQDPFRSRLAAAGYSKFDELPLGAVVAIAHLKTWHKTEEVRDLIRPDELAFGNYSDGRVAWEFDDVFRLPASVPVIGRQGIFRWDPDEETVRRIHDWRPKS